MLKKILNIKKIPLVSAIVLSTLCFSILGFSGRNTIYTNLKINLLKNPLLTVVFEGIAEGTYPWKTGSSTYNEITNNDISNNHTTNKNISKTKNIDPSDSEIKKMAEDNGKSAHESTDSNSKKSIPNTAKKEKTKSKTYSFEKVSQKYFNDALFIGDSRTVGLSEYSGWDNSTFYADVGLTIYDIFDKNIAEVDGNKITIDQALEKQQFGKIYIMLGINELGRGTTDLFIKEYKKVILKIQKLQPKAIIFVEGIMNVSKVKSDTDPIFNNINIKDKNDHLSKLANNKTIFYIDINEVITDKTGGIPSEYTFDNIHLKAAYYKIWTDFLKKHGIKRNKRLK